MPGAPAQELGEHGCRLEHLLEVVEDEQRAPPAAGGEPAPRPPVAARSRSGRAWRRSSSPRDRDRRSVRARRTPSRATARRPSSPRPPVASCRFPAVPSASGVEHRRGRAARGSLAAPSHGPRTRSSARPGSASVGRFADERIDRASVELRILVEDCPFESSQRRPGLDPELLDERLPRRPVRRQRVGLPARAVEREHQLAAQSLAQRVLGDECFELGNELGCATEREVGVDADPRARRGGAPRADRSPPAPTARRRSRRVPALATARAPRATCRSRPSAPPLSPRRGAARTGARRGSSRSTLSW